MTMVITGNGLSATSMGTGIVPFYKFAERTSQQTLTFNTYVEHNSVSFTLRHNSNVLMMYLPSPGYESGLTAVHAKFTVDGVDTGPEFFAHRTTNNNGLTSSPFYWYVNNMASGAHTVRVFLKLLTNTTAILPYTRGEVTRSYLGVIIYGT